MRVFNLIKAWYIKAWSTKMNPLGSSIWVLKNEGQEDKIGLIWNWVQEGGDVGIRKGWIWWICFVFIYENKRIKPAEIVLGRGGEREDDGRVKSEIYCKHICKYYNVTPVQLLYVNKI
jgi:hypothetical protein